MNEADPYEVVHIDAESVTLDYLRIKSPVKYIGNGKTTLRIKNRIIIDFRSTEKNTHLPGFPEEDVDFEEYVYKLKRDRVIFENLSIVWDKKPSSKAFNNFEIKQDSVNSYDKKEDSATQAGSNINSGVERSSQDKKLNEINNPDLSSATQLNG